MTSAENNTTLENLPRNVIHLGDNQFLVVRSFLGNTRVQIRKFIEYGEKKILPNTLAIGVWVGLTEKLPKVLSKRCFERNPNNHVEVVERDLCVFKEIEGHEENIKIMLERMFRRRDGTFQLVPETVYLNEQNCGLLLRSTKGVNDRSISPYWYSSISCREACEESSF